MCNNLSNELLNKGWIHKRNMYQNVFESIERYRSVNSPSISVIVISWRLHKDTLKSFKILESQRKHNFELIFVDNGGNEGEFAELKPYIDTYIKLNINTGAYLARNIGALFANAPILFFLEDDGIPDSDLIESHIEMFNSFDVIAVRGVYLPKTENLLNNRQLHYYHGNTILSSYSDLEGNSSYSSEIFYKVGGWNDSIKFGHGGIELAIRLLNLEPDRTKQVYSPASIIYHDYVKDESHFIKKSRKQEESLEVLKNKYKNWDQCIRDWKNDYYLGDKIIKKKEKSTRYYLILNRVLERNSDKVNQVNFGVIQRYSEGTVDINNQSRYNVIFGSGEYGKEALKFLKSQNIRLDFFTDNDSNKWGQEIEGLLVIDPKDLNHNHFTFIASSWFYEIAEQLERDNFRRGTHFAIVK